MIPPRASPHWTRRSTGSRSLSHCLSPLGYHLIRGILINLPGRPSHHVSHFPGPPCNYRCVFSLQLRRHVDPGSFFNSNFDLLPLVHSLLSPTCDTSLQSNDPSDSRRETSHSPFYQARCPPSSQPTPVFSRSPVSPREKPPALSPMKASTTSLTSLSSPLPPTCL